MMLHFGLVRSCQKVVTPQPLSSQCVSKIMSFKYIKLELHVVLKHDYETHDFLLRIINVILLQFIDSINDVFKL